MKRKPKPEKPMREYTPGEWCWLTRKGGKK